jgi:cytoskeleton protein RodZ
VSAMHDEAGIGADESERPEGSAAADLEAPVVVRRNAGLAALIGGGASAIAIAYLWRATQSGAVSDWMLCAVMAVVAGWHLARLLDARTPLVVADALGIRIRLGHQWRGLPWDAVAEVQVHPRRSVLHDGRLVFWPHSLDRALDGLESRGRRIAALNQKMYGAALAVPVGLTTRSSPDSAALGTRLTALAGQRVDTAPVESLTGEEPVPPARRPSRPGLVDGLGRVVSRFAKRSSRPSDEDPAVPDQPLLPAAFVAPLRETRPGLRAQVTRDLPATTLRSAALHEDAVARKSGMSGLPEGRELRRPGSVDLVFEPPGAGVAAVRPIARPGEPVEPLVIDDFPTEPALDPVIGTELAAARTRLGLSIDELADRTRIRPHVIESIEVDDFAPCGGDFYARGHLRTLARVLGQDPAPMLAQFDNRYATAPINARRVFEAELATGMTGSMRSTVGGPNWGLLIGVVLSLLLAWGVVRYFADEPAPVIHTPAPVLNGSAGVDREFPAATPQPATRPMRLTLVAAGGPSRVVVRDDQGRVVFAGRLGRDERKRLEVDPPAVVRARTGGAVRVRVEGQDRGRVGQPGEPGRRTVHRR